LTIGPPGAGKTSFVSWELVHPGEVLPTQVLSPDALLFVGGRYAWSPGRTGRAWQQVKEDFARLLTTGRNIALDATFVRRRDRAPFVEAARAAGYEVVAIFLDVPVDLLIERDAGREGQDRSVGAEVIERMVAALEPPEWGEGFSEIWRVSSDGSVKRETARP
jgi:predicted kinase